MRVSRPAPSSRGLGHGPFKAATRVRIPSGSVLSFPSSGRPRPSMDPPKCWRKGVEGAAAVRRRRREEWAAEAAHLWEQWHRDPLFLFGVALYWGEGAKV